MSGAASDGDAGRAQVDRHGRAQLAHGDGHGGDAGVEGEDVVGDAGGQPFEQAVALVGDHFFDRRRHRPVVDGVGERVGAPGGGQVGGQVDVDLEGLGPVSLLGQRPVGAEDPQPPQLDAVAQLALPDFPLRGPLGPRFRARATSSRPGGPIWRELICSTMAMAWASVCTRPAYTR